MRKWFLGATVAIIAAAAYIVWPLHTAWSIREAVKSGDSMYLDAHFDWRPVKDTLKASMSDMVLGPITASLDGKPQRASLWQRLKRYYGRSMVDTLIDRYANAEGLPTLFSYGRNVRTNVLWREDPDAGLSLPARVANAWSRIDRAEFITPTRFEIDMRDKYELDRVYAGVLHLRGWRWVVTELRVLQRAPNRETGDGTENHALRLSATAPVL